MDQETRQAQILQKARETLARLERQKAEHERWREENADVRAAAEEWIADYTARRDEERRLAAKAERARLEDELRQLRLERERHNQLVELDRQRGPRMLTRNIRFGSAGTP